VPGQASAGAERVVEAEEVGAVAAVATSDDGIGTHPIPTNYYETHQVLGTWQGIEWQQRLRRVLGDEASRASYD